MVSRPVAAPMAPGESARLDAVRRYAGLDAAPDPALDRIAGLAARLLGAPAAAVTVVDADRIRVIARFGFDGPGSLPRQPGLCGSVIAQDGPWVVTDATSDPRTAGNALVAGDPGVRFYAGVPLVAPDGSRLGSLCVLDARPRPHPGPAMEHLEDLAGLVVDGLERRLDARRTVEREARLRREAEELADALQASLLPPRPPRVPEMEVSTRYIAGETGLLVGGDFFDVFRLAHNDWGIVLGDVCGKGARPASLAMLARWAIRGASVHQFSPGGVLADVNALFAGDERAGDDRYCSALFARLQLDTCGAWLTVANAGHPRPILVRRSGKVEQRSLVTVPIGLFDRIQPLDDRVGLGSGDALVLYTDGITEARSPSGELLGEERLLALLSGLTGAPAEEIADRVIDSATAFSGGPLTDDAALVVVRVPDDAGRDPIGRVSSGTGIRPEDLRLPGYPKDTGPPGLRPNPPGLLPNPPG